MLRTTAYVVRQLQQEILIHVKLKLGAPAWFASRNGERRRLGSCRSVGRFGPPLNQRHSLYPTSHPRWARWCISSLPKQSSSFMCRSCIARVFGYFVHQHSYCGYNWFSAFTRHVVTVFRRNILPPCSGCDCVAGGFWRNRQQTSHIRWLRVDKCVRVCIQKCRIFCIMMWIHSAEVISQMYVTADFSQYARLDVQPLPGPLMSIGLCWGAVKVQWQVSRKISENLGQSGVGGRGTWACEGWFKVPPTLFLRANSMNVQVAVPS